MREQRYVGTLVLVGAIAVAACSTDPNTAKRRYVESGDRYVNQHKDSEAIIQYRNALLKDPTFGEAHLKLGAVLERTGDLTRALREYVRGADLMPTDNEAQLHAGKLLVAARQFPEARTRAAAVLARDPKNVNALIVMGNALAGLKDVDGAIAQIETAIDAQPGLTFGYLNLGTLEIRKGDHERAEQVFKKAVEVAPQSIDAHINLANYYWAMGKGAIAESEFKAALAIDPKSTLGNKLLATLYIMNGRRADAEPFIAAYAKADGTLASQLAIADYYLQGQKTKEAAAILEPLSKKDDGYAPALSRLAAIDFTAGKRQQAYATLDDVLKRDPKNAVATETKGRFLLGDQKYEEALRVFDTMLKTNPSGLRQMYLKAVALRSLGRIEEAVKAMAAVSQRAPTMTSIQLQLADLYLQKNDPKAAAFTALGVVKAEPRNGNAHLLYGEALLLSGNLAGAEPEIATLAKAYPTKPDLQVWLGRLYLAKNDRAKARQAFTKALELQPDSILALNGVVTLDVADKQGDAVRALLKSRLDSNPRDPSLLFLAANTYLTIGDIQQAEALFQRVLEIEPSNFAAYDRLGKIYLAQSRINDAKKIYENATDKKIHPVASETLLGMVLEMQNHVDEARKHYEDALALDPQAAVAANNLAWIYAQRGENLDTALQLAQTAKAQLPNAANVSDTLGWVYYQKGLAPLAITALKQATTQDPSNAMTRYRLGLAYLKNGDSKEAHAALEQALKLNPRFDAADDARRRLSEIKG